MSGKSRENTKTAAVRVNRKPRRKCFTKRKRRFERKNPDLCLTVKSAEELISVVDEATLNKSDEEHFSIDDEAAIANPPSDLHNSLQCDVVTPDNSTPPQVRVSTPSDLLPVTQFTAQPCSPIYFHSSTENILNKSQVDLKELNSSPNTLSFSANQSADVPFEVSDIQSVEAINISSDVHSVSMSQLIDDTPFKVAEMRILEESSECPETSCELQLDKTPGTPAKLNASTCDYMEVKARVKLALPPKWENHDRIGDNGIVLLRVADSRCFLPQIQIHICENGEVELYVHSRSLGHNHEIWGKLPERISLSTHSVSESFRYVLAVLNLVKAYEVCLGCHLPQYQPVAKKMANAVFSPNHFRESKYITTHRSVNCSLLVRPRYKYAACSECHIMIKNIRKRFKRLPMTGTPKVKTANKYLYTPQCKKKLEREKRLRRNTKAREMYYRNKIESLISKEGTDLDEGLSDDLSQILEKHYDAGDCSEVLDTMDISDDSEKSKKNLNSQKRKNVNNFLKIFIEEQIKAASVKKPCGMRWHPLMIRLALRIHMTSPAGYKAMMDSGIIKLPSERTLYDYSHYDKPEAGIDGPAVLELHNLLEKKNYGEDSHQRYHLLLMDEMTISKNLVYSRATGELTGFVHLSEIEKESENLELALEIAEEQADRVRPTKQRLLELDEAELIRKKSKELKDFGEVTPEIADKILSFMVVGITNSVKSVVASYGVKKQTNAEGLTARVWEVIAKLERASVKILGIVCDGHPVNRSFIKKHKPSHRPLPSGTVFSTINRVARSREIFFFSDVPHLIKTLRNCLFNSEGGKKTRCLKKNGQLLSWHTIMKLYNDEKDCELRLAYKLNAQVVYLNGYSGMKVSYAVRVLSGTVANAIEAMGYPDTEELVLFIRKANEFFDCLNGCSSAEAVRKRNINLAPYQTANDHRFQILRDYLDYLLAWSTEVEDPRFCISHETLTGIEMTINSYEKCCQFLFSKGAKYIMARKFCQDPLEHFFGKQRASCGGSTNPNMARFLGNQTKIRLLKTLKFKTNGNTEDLTDNGTLADLSAPLPKRKRGMSVENRVRTVRRKLACESDFTT